MRLGAPAVVLACALAALPPVALPALAAPQEAADTQGSAVPPPSEPGEPHRVLAATAGTFAMTVKSWVQPPPADPVVSQGEAVRTMLLGGRVLQETASVDFAGFRFEGLGYTGYDNVLGSYWSTWMDTMGTGCFVSQGSVDEATGTMTFHGEYADPADGHLRTARVVITPRSDGGSLFEWFEVEDGHPAKTIEILYERKP